MVTPKCLLSPPSLGRQAPHGGRRPGKHFLGLRFFSKLRTRNGRADLIWPRRSAVSLPARNVYLEPAESTFPDGGNPACIQALGTAMAFAIKVSAKLLTCPDSKLSPIINAAQNLATGRWTIIIMPKISPSPSENKRDSSHLLPASPRGSPSAATYARSAAPRLTSIDPARSQ